MTLIAMVEGLVAAEIRVVLVGGLAARAHGVERVTDDVDVCYDTGYLNERALVKLLRSWDAYPRDVMPGLPFQISRAYLHEHDTVRLSTVHGYLDLMREVPGIGQYSDVVSHADTMRLASGHVLPLINLEKLIRAKETANRAKDQEVLHELRAVRAAKRLRELGATDLDIGSEPSRRPEPPGEAPPPVRKGRRR